MKEMKTLRKMNNIPLSLIEKWLKDEDWKVRRVAVNACNGRKIPLDLIEKWLKDEDYDVIQAAMNACKGGEVPLDLIEKWLKNKDWRVRQAAMNACKGREVSLDLIERGLRDKDYDVRQTAVDACNGREAPLSLIEKWLKDEDDDVRGAAIRMASNKGMVTRMVDLPKRVYKKCLGNVIVVAEIPNDAHVRGHINGKCRASKAKIIDIIGDLCGEKLAISCHDCETYYQIGDEIEIDNFDMSEEECAPGFHFFCTREQAEKYDF